MQRIEESKIYLMVCICGYNCCATGYSKSMKTKDKVGAGRVGRGHLQLYSWMDDSWHEELYRSNTSAYDDRPGLLSDLMVKILIG